MQIMVQHFKAGFAADDQTREYIHEAKLGGSVVTFPSTLFLWV